MCSYGLLITRSVLSDDGCSLYPFCIVALAAAQSCDARLGRSTVVMLLVELAHMLARAYSWMFRRRRLLEVSDMCTSSLRLRR